MTTEHPFRLTTKDHAILQIMLERYRGPQGAYVRLLERKLRESAVCFRDDIPPDVVTLNTRLTYRVNGTRTGPHLLVQAEADDLPSFALSLYTPRGLALLGLAAGASLTVGLAADASETLTVEDILSQPEAEARLRETAGFASGKAGK